MLTDTRSIVNAEREAGILHYMGDSRCRCAVYVLANKRVSETALTSADYLVNHYTESCAYGWNHVQIL